MKLNHNQANGLFSLRFDEAVQSSCKRSREDSVRLINEPPAVCLYCLANLHDLFKCKLQSFVAFWLKTTSSVQHYNFLSNCVNRKIFHVGTSRFVYACVSRVRVSFIHNKRFQSLCRSPFSIQQSLFVNIYHTIICIKWDSFLIGTFCSLWPDMQTTMDVVLA